MKTYYMVSEMFGFNDSTFTKHTVKAKNIYEALTAIIPYDEESSYENAEEYFKAIGAEIVFDKTTLCSGRYSDEEHSIGFGKNHAEACQQYIQLRIEMG